MNGLTVALVVLLVTSPFVKAAWEQRAPNILTVALGASAKSQNELYISGGDNGAGAVIYHSTDGGYNFQSLPHDPQMMYLSVDVRGESGVAGSLGFYGQVAPASYTNDGYQWNAAGQPFLFSSVQSVTALDNSTFFTIGQWMDGLVNATYLEGVGFTTDGGKTWTYSDWSEASGDLWPRYGAFLDKDTWIITGGIWPAKSTRDTRKVFNVNQYFEIHLDEATKSSKVHVNYRTSAPPARNTKTEGYEGVIVRSADGGRTWQRVFYDAGRFYFNGIDCVETTCWAVAEGPSGGYIFTSADGGVTWREQHFFAGISLLDIEFPNRLDGFIVGGIILANTFDALFLRSRDGGLTWTEEPTLPNTYPNALSMIDGKYGYATGFLRNGASTLLAYTDDQKIHN